MRVAQLKGLVCPLVDSMPGTDEGKLAVFLKMRDGTGKRFRLHIVTEFKERI